MSSHQDCSHEKKQQKKPKQNKTKKKTKKTIKKGALKEKLKIGELTPEASFAEKSMLPTSSAEKIRKTEELEKLKVRSQIFDEINHFRYLADRYIKRNNPTLMGDKT